MTTPVPSLGPDPDRARDLADGLFDDYDDGVFCPFSGDGRCPSTPTCPTPRQRACTGYGEED